MMMMKIRFGAAVLAVASGMKFFGKRGKQKERRELRNSAEKTVRSVAVDEGNSFKNYMTKKRLCAKMQTVIDGKRAAYAKEQFEVHVINVEEIGLSWERDFSGACRFGTCPEFHDDRWPDLNSTVDRNCKGCQSICIEKELPFYCKKCDYAVCSACHSPRSIENVFHGTLAIDEIMENGFDIQKASPESAALLGKGHYAAECFEHCHPKYTKRIGDVRGQESRFTGRFEILVCDIFIPGRRFLGDATNLRVRVPSFSSSVTCIQGSYQMFTEKSWPYYCVESDRHILPRYKVTYQYQYRDGVESFRMTEQEREERDTDLDSFDPL